MVRIEATTHPAPPSSIIGGKCGKQKTPPPMHRSRCLREPSKIHQRRRNCTDRQCPSDASLSSVSQASLRRLPFAVRATSLHPPHAGNLALSPLRGRTQRIIPKPPRSNQLRPLSKLRKTGQTCFPKFGKLQRRLWRSLSSIPRFLSAATTEYATLRLIFIRSASSGISIS